MDSVQRSHLFHWNYIISQDKAMDELSESVLTTIELEETRLKAQEGIKLRDLQIYQLKEMLASAIKERDQAREKCQKLSLEKMLLQQQLQQQAPNSGISSNIDNNNNNLSSSDCDESIVSSPPHVITTSSEISGHREKSDYPLVINKPLPEKGQFLQAVIKAGPLLQTLLLAGPLPKWRHPPPQLDTRQIPPPPVVAAAPPLSSAVGPQIHVIDSVVSTNVFASNICGRTNRRKRSSSGFGGDEGSDSSSGLKYQRVVLQ